MGCSVPPVLTGMGISMTEWSAGGLDIDRNAGLMPMGLGIEERVVKTK